MTICIAFLTKCRQMEIHFTCIKYLARGSFEGAGKSRQVMRIYFYYQIIKIMRGVENYFMH